MTTALPMRFLDATQALPEGTLHWSNTEDVLQHAEALRNVTAIALEFPKWTDGRAYSQAVLLRLRLAFRGDVIATGQVLADMLPLLRRCGFSAVRLRADQSRETAQRALGFFDGHYQRAVGDACGTDRAVAPQTGAHALASTAGAAP